MIKPTETIIITPSVLKELKLTMQVRKDVIRVDWRAGKLKAFILALFPYAFYLHISVNNVSNLDELLHEGRPVMPYLVRIDCPNNDITDLYPLRFQRLLAYLNIENNCISTLRGLEGCTHITTLICSGNQIKDYRAIIYLPSLYSFSCNADPETVRLQPKLVRQIMSAPWSIPRLSSHGMHDPKFCDTADRALHTFIQGLDNTQPDHHFLDANSDDLFDYGIKSNVELILVKLCGVKTKHPGLGITFERLMDYVWKLILSKVDPTWKDPTLYDLTGRLCTFMLYVEHMDIEDLFRYTILAIKPYVNNITIEFSTETIIDKKIAIILSKNSEASIRHTCSVVFASLSTSSIPHDSMPILIYAIAEFKDCQNGCLPPSDIPETEDDRDLTAFASMFNARAAACISNPIACAA